MEARVRQDPLGSAAQSGNSADSNRHAPLLQTVQGTGLMSAGGTSATAIEAKAVFQGRGPRKATRVVLIHIHHRARLYRVGTSARASAKSNALAVDIAYTCSSKTAFFRPPVVRLE